jgi:hypothetical protein
MSNDPDAPIRLISTSHEIEAAAIVNALQLYGIKSHAAGGYTSGFRAEAPGTVDVLVRQADFDQAKKALAEIQKTNDTD